MEHEGYYGDFIEGLGPSQMVGRQVLGLPCMGEIQLSIADRKGQLEVEVIRARELVAKPGAKVLPGKNSNILSSLNVQMIQVIYLCFFLNILLVINPQN